MRDRWRTIIFPCHLWLQTILLFLHWFVFWWNFWEIMGEKLKRTISKQLVFFLFTQCHFFFGYEMRKQTAHLGSLFCQEIGKTRYIKHNQAFSLWRAPEHYCLVIAQDNCEVFIQCMVCKQNKHKVLSCMHFTRNFFFVYYTNFFKKI